MPFKLKLKKSRQYNVASKNVFVISVEMLDNTVVECTLSSQSLGKECLGSLCQRQGLQQPEYFGLKYLSKYGSLWWVDLERPLKKQLDRYAQESLTPRLHLGVMFFVSDVTLLHDEVTRNHYFLQLKTDFVEGHLKCTPEQAVLLAGYSLQAEFSDHDPERHTTEYLTNFAILPKSLITSKEAREALLERVILAHRNFHGLTTSLAEIYYIAESQMLEGYGQQIFSTKDHTGTVLYIGASMNGIFLKPMGGSSQQPTSFRWQEIVNLIHHRRHFGIECHQSEKTVQCHLEDIDVAKYVWKMCAQQHRFYNGQRITQFPKNTIVYGNNSMLSNHSANLENSNQMLASQESLDELGVYHMEEHRENVTRPEDVRISLIDSRRLSDQHLNASQSRLNEQQNQLLRLSQEANLNAHLDQTSMSTQHLPHHHSVQHHSSATQLHLTTQLNREESYAFQTNHQNFHSSQEINGHPHIEDLTQSVINNSQVSLQNLQLGSDGDLAVPDYSRRLTLPAYRQAPDYDTAIRHKYLQSASVGDISVSSSYGRNSTVLTDSQPSLGGGKNPQLYTHYRNYVDLSHIESMNSITDGHLLQNTNGLPQHYSNLLMPPTQTYSTPELHTQAMQSDLSTEQLLASIQMNAYHQCKSPPPYPFNVQRPSASTPDLTHNNNSNAATITPDLVSRRHLPAISSDNIANHVDLASLHAMNRQNSHHTNPPFNTHTTQKLPSENQVPPTSSLNLITRPPPPYMPGNGTQQVTQQPVNYNFGSNSRNETRNSQNQTNPNAPPSMGPMLVAAINGLTLSPPDVVGIPSDKRPLSRDSRIQLLEARLMEGQFFLEFEQIPKRKPMASFDTALLPENDERNRFRDVLPYEENRVHLTPTKDNRTGYINASHISVSVGNSQRFYIAAQGPLPNTVHSFWQMVWENHVSLIVMLTETQEQGKDKCTPYWPLTDHAKIQVNEFQVSRSFSVSSSTYVTCSLVLSHGPSRTQRSIWHIQYTDWPDHRCPQDLQGFLSFMEEIDAVRRLAMNEQPPGRGRNSPVLVHCSAGVGRSGVTILCDIMLYSLDHATETLDMAKLLTQLRYQRMLTIQTLAQYKFVYSVLIQYLKNSRLI